jgi:hypothetical protein
MSLNNRKLKTRRSIFQYKGTNNKLTSQYLPEKVLSTTNLNVISQSQNVVSYKISNNEINIIYTRRIPNLKQTNIEVFSDVYSMGHSNLGSILTNG